MPDDEDPNKEHLMGVDNDTPNEETPLPEVGMEAYEERIKSDMATGEQKKVIGKKASPISKQMSHSSKGKLTQGVTMKACLLKGIRISKPQKQPAHWVWAQEKKVKEFQEMSVEECRQVEKKWEDANISGLGTKRKTKKDSATASLRKLNTNAADYQSAVMWCFDNLPVEDQRK
ncbi:hypothetical protein GYMLUDRAFT_60423 [Collybiopsis luxurians FD-317 M1]|uniref:Uncharacterized protein n=1 Tax=Collybiopsis luxurians FD-317 M1 TaxID=944289 RepID=A0A0D0CKD9_9AGAR|nr:hypothetical protein GYMLUDRAFT_60423 [Collybiopsis luxurians FD-317 M1]